MSEGGDETRHGTGIIPSVPFAQAQLINRFAATSAAPTTWSML